MHKYILYERGNTFLSSYTLILGILYSSQLGFIAKTSSFDGLPRTLIISINYLILELPGKIGFPMIISAITHPIDHTSIAFVYSVAPNINSGAL